MAHALRGSGLLFVVSPSSATADASSALGGVASMAVICDGDWLGDVFDGSSGSNAGETGLARNCRGSATAAGEWACFTNCKISGHRAHAYMQLMIEYALQLGNVAWGGREWRVG